jgi:selenocysteine lyase/cysteine desulfurase
MLNYWGIASMNASLKFISEFGFDEVKKQTLEHTARIAELFKLRGANIVSPQGASERSGIVAAKIEDSDGVAKRLNENNIVVASRRGFLRFSPYFYNTEEEVKKAVNAVFD